VPILDERNLEFISHSPEQTQRLGVRLGELLEAGTLVCLVGDLGAGKTTFAQGVARGWGALDAVTSPTFVLINQYRRADSAVLFHVDAFRLKDQHEAQGLGLTEVMEGPGPMMVEWADRIVDELPADALWVELKWEDDSRRRLEFDARGPSYEALLKRFRQAAFGG
jgi:tRNA threonylcarbamoyladenosine biosynthesis protein TsaE